MTDAGQNGKPLKALPGGDAADGVSVNIAPDNKGNVVMTFSKPITWMAIPNDGAIKLATNILGTAGGSLKIVYPPEAIATFVDTIVAEPDRDEAIKKATVMLNGG